MKWNAKPLAGFGLMLTACAGSAQAQSIGAQAWGDPYAAQSQQPRGPAPLPPQADQASETWRAADGTIRTRQRTPAAQTQTQPQPQPTKPQHPGYPAPQSSGAGAGYAIPGSDYTPPAHPQPQPQPQPQLQRYTPPAPRQPASTLPQNSADPTAGMSGPRGSSQPGAGEQRYDEVGYAGIRSVSGGGDANQAVVAVHRSLPVNTIVEVTSLDTGRTVLVLITGSMAPGSDHPIDLSAGAAAQLGLPVGSGTPVRVRSVVASPQDVLALRAARPAGSRPDAPQVLLTALRKRLSTPPVAAAPQPAYRPPSSPARRPAAPAPRPAAKGRYFVQVAALSSSANAQSLARSLGGSVKAGGGLYRVQLGPFATSGEAERARAGAARAGYRDARVFAIN